MRDELKAQIAQLMREGNAVKLVALIEHEYEFDCPSFVYAGPGHQSHHTCTRTRPHPIDGEHADDLYEWVGTATFEILDDPCLACKGTGGHSGKCYVCEGSGHRRKLINAPHEGYNCDCRIPSGARP